jgi:hypothetical protein
MIIYQVLLSAHFEQNFLMAGTIAAATIVLGVATVMMSKFH